MQSASLRRLFFASLLAPMAGCYSPGNMSPGPYGQPYQPVYPGNPGYTMPPGQPYVPGGTPMQPGLGGPTPLPVTPPNGSPPSTYDNNGGAANGGGIQFQDAPAFSPTPTTPPADPGRGAVPDPVDDINGGGPAAERPTLSPTSAQEFDSPFEQESRAPQMAPPARVGSEPELFEPPDRVQSLNEGTGTIRRVSFETPAAQSPNPFGRDRKNANPQWLRGIVSFDPRTRSWELIYSGNPDPHDPNGGSLTLANHPSLSKCRDGDVVLVEGAIDGEQTDQRGKPLYALDKVTPLTLR